ncbi:MAG: hypothetical protein QXY50_02765 [Candidatus Caldarchaeum sp.]
MSRLEDFSPELAVKVVQSIRQALVSGRAPPNPRIYRQPDSEYFRRIERIAVDEVYAWFERTGAPIFRDTLIEKVRAQILGRKAQGLWRDVNGVELPIPGYDTIRRRVNAVCEEQYYEGRPPCLMVGGAIGDRLATFYFPNPSALPSDKAAKVEEVLRRWRLG